MKDIAKGLVHVGIFLIPAVVLIISNTMFFPFITGKNFTFRILVEVIFAAWVILALYDPQYRPRFSWVGASFLLLLGVMFFANLLGEYPLQSFWNNFERMEGYVTLVHVFLYVLVAGSVLKTEKVWDRFFMWSIGIAIILSFYAFAQLSGNIVINQGGVRLDGTLGNSAYMAIYMLFHTFITLFMLLREKNVGMRYVYGGLALLFMYLLLQTATRGTVLGLIGGLFVTGSYIALFSKTYPHIRKFAIWTVVSIFTVVTLFITFKDSSFVQSNVHLQRIATISLSEAGNRFNIWSMALEGVKERPVLGWGQSNYNYVFNKYYRPELHAGEAWFDRVHNIVMDWLIAGGIVGMLAYFGVVFSAVYYLFLRPLLNKEDTSFAIIERGVLLGLLSGYMIHNFVVFDNIVSYIFYGSILAYIHARVSTPISQIEHYKVDIRIVEQVVAPAVAFVLVMTVYYINVPGIQASKDIIHAFRATDPQVMLSHFEQALSRGSFGKQEIREQLTQRVQSVLRSPEVSEEIKKKLFTRVEEELLKQIEEKPGDARVEVFISSFYRVTGNVDKAMTHLEIARTLSPKKQLIIFEQGFAHLQKGEKEKALGYFKEAYDLGPQFTDSRVFYAMAAIYAGQLGLVDELIQTPEQKQAFAFNETAIQAVYQAKMYPLLIEMFSIQIEKNPQDPQVRTNLAFVLNESGKPNEAIEALKKAGEEIPSFKTQAEEFIKSIAKDSIPAS